MPSLATGIHSSEEWALILATSADWPLARNSAKPEPEGQQGGRRAGDGGADGAWELVVAAGAEGARALSVEPRRPLGGAHQLLAFARLRLPDVDVLEAIGRHLAALPTVPVNHFRFVNPESPPAEEPLLGQQQPSSCFGTEGLLNSMGTRMGTRPWQNPCTSGDVVCEWVSAAQFTPACCCLLTAAHRAQSSVGDHSDVSRFVERPGREPSTWCCAQSRPTFFMTALEQRLSPPAEAYMALDLGPGRAIALEHYALRNDGSRGQDALRCWSLQGAQFLSGPWHTLRVHHDDTSLAQEPWAEAAWAVGSGSAPGPYRCFRIKLGAGQTAANNYAISCGGIELFGWTSPTRVQ